MTLLLQPYISSVNSRRATAINHVCLSHARCTDVISGIDKPLCGHIKLALMSAWNYFSWLMCQATQWRSEQSCCLTARRSLFRVLVEPKSFLSLHVLPVLPIVPPKHRLRLVEESQLPLGVTMMVMMDSIFSNIKHLILILFILLHSNNMHRHTSVFLRVSIWLFSHRNRLELNWKDVLSEWGLVTLQAL